MRVVDFYKTQVRVLWSWKGGPLALIWRFVVTILVAVLSFIATAALVPDITIASIAAAIGAVILMTLFNGLIRTALLVLVAPYSLIWTGVLVLLLQVMAFLVVARWVPGIAIPGFWTALIG